MVLKLGTFWDVTGNVLGMIGNEKINEKLRKTRRITRRIRLLRHIPKE